MIEGIEETLTPNAKEGEENRSTSGPILAQAPRESLNDAGTQLAPFDVDD